MQQAEGAHSATGAIASSTNIVPFPICRHRRSECAGRLPRRPRGNWPCRSGRRTPELLIALALCKVLTEQQLASVLLLLESDCRLNGDNAGREAFSLVGTLA